MSAIPTFSRIEIRSGGKEAIGLAAASLRALAASLDVIASSDGDDEAAAILARHKISAASNRLRKEMK